MKQDDTKQKIIDKALELFAAKGYDSVSVGEIAKAVGIKAPSLYNHYPSKQAIFDAIVESTAEQYDEDTNKIDIHVQNAEKDVNFVVCFWIRKRFSIFPPPYRITTNIYFFRECFRCQSIIAAQCKQCATKRAARFYCFIHSVHLYSLMIFCNVLGDFWNTQYYCTISKPFGLSVNI